MKYKNLFFLTLLICQNLFSQTQIGSDIDGESSGDLFGYGVGMSSDGLTFAAGAIGGNYVKVYNYNNNSWQLVGSKINGPVGSENFGHSVAISSDGTILAVGDRKFVRNNTGQTEDIVGAVYVYQYSDGSWSQLGSTLVGTQAGAYFGFDVSLSSDGSILAFGAPKYDLNDNNFQGVAKIYQYSSGSWSQLGSDIDGDVIGERLGYDVDLSSDGTIIAVGSPYYTSASSDNFGNVKIFQ